MFATQPVIQNPAIGDQGNFVPVQAMFDTALDGFMVRNDYLPIVRNIMRTEMLLWPQLVKEAAEGDQVQGMSEGQEPYSGFVDKIDLNPPENPTDIIPFVFNGVPQGIKAIGGVIKFGHYARSLYDQQGKPYGDIAARRTQKLLQNVLRNLERALFIGNATRNPLEFNGIEAQMHPDNRFHASVINGDSVVQKLRSIIRLAVNDPYIIRRISYIWCSGLALELIEEEVQQKLEYHNLDEIRPGLRVPAIVTQAGLLPIIPTPFLQDIRNPDGPDQVVFYLMEKDALVWKGVYPQGGQRTLEPQIFEVGSYTQNAAPYLLEKRMALCYGTLFAENNGLGLYRLTVDIPKGRIGTI
jgi:hypothetical protein